MSGLLLAALSLLISVATSTFEYPKSSGGYPTSLKPIIPAIAPLQVEQDQRMTHWESRSNSNLDDDRAENDRDEGRGRISYSPLVEQRYPLTYPRITEQSLKLSKDINLIAENDENYVKPDHACVAVPGQPVVLVTFSNAKRTLSDVRDLQKSDAYSKVFGTVRCRRRFNGWNVQDPLYVEEPGWIVIDLDGQKQGHAVHEQDPFYVARGKRALKFSDKNQERNDETDSSITFPKAIARIKRESFNDAKSRSLLGIDGESSVRKSQSNGYVQLRNKHSDILDILNEPFFISRGKKNSLRIGLLESDDRYARALENLESRKRALDGLFSRVNRDEVSNRWNLVGSSLAVPSPDRDRRGIMEELLKEADPFYVARGKRSMKVSDLSVSTSKETLSSVESIDSSGKVKD